MNKLKYTGQTEGFIRVPGGTLDVKPGLTIKPDDDQHQKALLATGHFQVLETKTSASADKESK